MKKFFKVLLLMMLLIPIMMTTTAHAADDDFADAIKSISKKSDDVKPSNAGDAWSYMGPKSEFFGIATQTTSTTSYDNIDDKQLDNSSSAGNFGYMLYSTGIDHSTQNNSYIGDSVTKVGRLAFGNLVLLGYMANSYIMYGFRLIINLTDILVVAPLGVLAPTFESSSMPEALRSFYTYVHSIFNNLSQFGILLAVLLFVFFLGISILGVHMNQKTGSPESVKTGVLKSIGGFLTKLFVILLYPMLLLGVLSGSVAAVKVAFQNLEVSSPAAYAIYSNLFDFGGAVEGSRLSLPNDLLSKIPSSTSSSDVPVITHKQILALNAFSAGRKNAQDIYNGLYTSGENSSFSDQVFNTKSEDVVNSGDFTSASTPAVSKMITQWASGAEYQASNWVSFVAKYVKRDDFEDKIKGSDGKGGDFTKNGTLDVKSGYFTTSTAVKNGTVARLKPDEKGGLSTAGMYNYLSSVFDATNVVWVDNTKLDTSSTQSTHYTVGLVGRNIVAFSNYMIMISMIIAVDVLGLICVVGTFSSMWSLVTRGISQILPIALGSAKGFTTSLIWVAMVIGNLISGPLAFILGSQLLQVFISVGSDAFDTGNGSDAANALFGVILPHVNTLGSVTTAGAISSGLYSAINLLMSLVILYSSVKIGLLRNHIYKTVTQVTEDLIERIKRAIVIVNQNQNYQTAAGGATGGGANNSGNNAGGPPTLPEPDMPDGNEGGSDVAGGDGSQPEGELMPDKVGGSGGDSSGQGRSGGANSGDGEVLEGDFREVAPDNGGSDNAPQGDFNGDYAGNASGGSQQAGLPESTTANGGSESRQSPNPTANHNGATPQLQTNVDKSNTQNNSATDSIANSDNDQTSVDRSFADNNSNAGDVLNSSDMQSQTSTDSTNDIRNADTSLSQSQAQNAVFASQSSNAATTNMNANKTHNAVGGDVQNSRNSSNSSNLNSANSVNNTRATNRSNSNTNATNNLTSQAPYSSIQAARNGIASARADLAQAKQASKTSGNDRQRALNNASVKIASANLQKAQAKGVLTVDNKQASKAFGAINSRGELMNKNLTNGQVRASLANVNKAYNNLAKAKSSGVAQNVTKAQANLKNAINSAQSIGINRSTMTSRQAVVDSMKTLRSEYDRTLGISKTK